MRLGVVLLLVPALEVGQGRAGAHAKDVELVHRRPVPAHHETHAPGGHDGRDVDGEIPQHHGHVDGGRRRVVPGAAGQRDDHHGQRHEGPPPHGKVTDPVHVV